MRLTEGKIPAGSEQQLSLHSKPLKQLRGVRTVIMDGIQRVMNNFWCNCTF